MIVESIRDYFEVKLKEYRVSYDIDDIFQAGVLIELGDKKEIFIADDVISFFDRWTIVNKLEIADPLLFQKIDQELERICLQKS